MSSTATIPRTRNTSPLLIAGFGLAILCNAFWQEGAAAIDVWLGSTAYSHCFLVLPIAAYLAWERRASYATSLVRPTLGPAVLALPVAVIWFAADRLGLMEGRQLAALSLVELMLVGVIGWRLSLAFAAPLLYLFFLVPVGAFLTPGLQSVTSGFIGFGLHALGIPSYVDGNLIDIPEGRFYVAEACAGLRFLIASIAFGVLYALELYRSPGRRAIFIAASALIPIAANGVRALGIVLAGHWLGSAEAAAADHLIYGWVFFSAVTLTMAVAGLPFHEPAIHAKQPAKEDSNAATMSPVMVMAAVVLAACIGPAYATLSTARDALPTSQPQPEAPSGCYPASSSPVASEPFVCGPVQARVSVTVFQRRATADILLHARAAALGDTDAAADDHVTRAAAVWIDGQSFTGSLDSRVRQAWRSILGGGGWPVLLSISLQGGTSHERQAVAAAFTAEPPLWDAASPYATP